MISFLVFGALVLSWLGRRVYRSYAVSREASKHGCQPFAHRYPHLDILGGLDLSLQTWRNFRKGQLSEGMRRRHETLGSTYVAKELGADCIYTVDPENIRTVTTTNFERWGKSAWVEEAAKHVGHGILMNEGEAWKRSKAMLKPIFSRTAFDEPTLLEPHIQELVRSMRREGGKAFDFQEVVAMFMLDVVTDFLFGQSTHCLSKGPDAQEATRFLGLVREFEPPSGTFIAVGMLAWIELLPSYRQLISVVNGMKAFFRKKLDSIMSSENTLKEKSPVNRDVSPSIFRMMKAQGVPDEQIQGELQNIFFASWDTTTALVSNIVHVISSRPDIQARLRDEISILGGNAPTNQDLAKLEYLRFVIWETLRLYSPVTSHSRQARKDTTLPKGGGGDGQSPVFVPAGTTIIWSTYSLNRSPELYGPDWADYRPERWVQLKAAGGTDFFMPFGSGPRTCMGQQMVQVEAAYIIVRLLQNFGEIRNEDYRPFKEAKAVSFYNANGTIISVRG